MREQQGPLEKQIPHELYSRDDYPAIDLEDSGTSIPRAYGNIFGAEPTTLDKAAKRFKLVHHAIRSINAIRINRSISTRSTETIGPGLFSLHTGTTYATNETREVVNVTFAGADLTQLNSKESVETTLGSWTRDE